MCATTWNFARRRAGAILDWTIRGALDRRLYMCDRHDELRALCLSVWWAVTALELVDPLFLPGPAAVLRCS